VSDFDLVHLGGRVLHAADARIDPRDVALVRGQALIETVAIARGRALLLEPHLERFERAVRLAGFPECEPQRWRAALEQLLAASGVLRGAARLLFSPGAPGGEPTRLVSLRPLVAYPPEGLVGQLVRGGWADPGGIDELKHSGRLARVLLEERARAAGADVCLVARADGRLLGATAANLVVVLGGRAFTPMLEPGILAGVVRGLLVAQGALHEAALSCADLATAEEVAVTSSLLGCRPLRSVLGVHDALPGPRGPVVQRLAALLGADVP
jgi:branched-subunit amino acid aminotransferase/4-amino-4-deoxychorismate lyase